jgi:hypothetical protein
MRVVSSPKALLTWENLGFHREFVSARETSGFPALGCLLAHSSKVVIRSYTKGKISIVLLTQRCYILI